MLEGDRKECFWNGLNIRGKSGYNEASECNTLKTIKGVSGVEELMNYT
jgi:hypothetical protein